MKTLIVHLPPSTERIAHMRMQIAREAITDYELVLAVDGNKFSPPNRTLASLITHKNATNLVIQHKCGPVLILEDDAVLVTNFQNQLKAHIDTLSKMYKWDVAFIGYNTQGNNIWNTTIPGWKIKQGDQPVHDITFSGGWAYVINGPKAARKMLKLMDETVANYPFHDMMIKTLVNQGKLNAAWLCFRLADHGWFESTIKHYENNEAGETLPQYISK